jgi:hypothetical protein
MKTKVYHFFEQQCVKYVHKYGSLRQRNVPEPRLPRIWFKLCSKVEFKLRKLGWR